MTKPKKPTDAAAHPTQGAVPPIDRENAENLQPVEAAPESEGDVPMPAVENSPGSIFQPKAGIGTVDVLEIAIMYLLELSGSPLQIQQGALRSVPLSAARVAMLSEQAQKHMALLAAPAAVSQPAPEPVAPPNGTAH